MKLLLFILGITLITASPTLRGLLNLNLGESGENTEGIFVVFEGHEDVNALSDNFSFNWNFDNNGESGESSLEQALEEENIIISEEEILPDLLTQVRNDPATNDILDFGVSTVIASGIEKGKIPNITFTVTSISALATTTSNQGDLYDFSLEANGQNGNSSSVIDMNFTVYYDFASQRRILSAYSFVITTTTVTVTPSQPSGPQNGYVKISDADIETNAEVQEVLEYGIEQIYTIGTQAGNIPAFGSFKANIVSVWKQVTNTGANYLCEVVLDNKNNVTVNANFTVAYVANTQQSTLTSYKYTVSNIIVTPPSNNTNSTTPSQPTNTTNPTTPVGNNNSTNTTTNATIDGFTALSADEIQSAPVQAALGYGVNQILENGYAKGKIPVSQYNVGNVSSVLEKTVGKRTTYRFAAVISGANKANISATFDVFLQNSNFSMGGWTYNITTIRNATNPTNSTNTTTPTQPTNTTNSTTPTGPTNTTNSTTPTGPTNTTTPTQPANNTNTTTPVGNNNSTNTTTNATTGGFTALSAAQIQSAQVQAVLAYGTNQLIQSGNAKGKIPVSVYNITKVNSVLMTTQAKSTLYESDVVLQDANNVTIAAVFNVSVNAATQGLFVNGWSYTVTNLKPQNNTNTTATTASTTTNTTSVNTNNSTNTNTNTISTPNTISTANTTDSTNNTTSANNATTPAVPITPVATNNSTNTTGTTSN